MQESSVSGVKAVLIADSMCRNCLGQQLAKINVPTAVAMLTREFHMTLAPQVSADTRSLRLPSKSCERCMIRARQERGEDSSLHRPALLLWRGEAVAEL